MNKLICSSFCSKTVSHRYYGLTQGKKCYCYPTLGSGKVIADGNCSVTCLGSAPETCGGASAIAIYDSTIGSGMRLEEGGEQGEVSVDGEKSMGPGPIAGIVVAAVAVVALIAVAGYLMVSRQSRRSERF